MSNVPSNLASKLSTSYIVIPARVKLDKNITHLAKLLYGDISGLCDLKGYCFALNNHFADDYGVSVGTVSKAISSLEKSGYISIEIKYKKGTKHILGRHIYINDPMLNLTIPLVKNNHTSSQKSHDPMVKKDIDNNTINITNNNTVSTSKSKRFAPPTIDEIKIHIAENNLTIDAEKFFFHYEANGWMVGKNKMKNWQAATRTWQRNNLNNTGAKNGTKKQSYFDKITSDAIPDSILEDWNG